MKAQHLMILASVGAALSSCISYSPQVPEIPYQSNGGINYQGIHTSIPDTWVTEQPGSYSPATTATQQASVAARQQANLPAIPDPKTDTKAQEAAAKVTPKPLDLSKPLISTTPKPTITANTMGTLTVPTTTATSTPAAATKPADLASITNQGPIPVATRVEGDPTRVYNPLDPSKTIRVIDKNGNPHPSGKLLKVRGTNFQFYVP